MVSIIFLFLAISTTLYPMETRFDYRKARERFIQTIEDRLARNETGETLESSIEWGDGLKVKPLSCSALYGDNLNRANAILLKYLQKGATSHSESGIPLSLAIIYGDKNSVKHLLDHGANARATIEVPMGPHWQMLRFACLFKNKDQREKIVMLLERGADINAGEVPVLHALVNGIDMNPQDEPLIDFLLSKGADPERLADRNLCWTAKQFAENRKHARLAAKL